MARRASIRVAFTMIDLLLSARSEIGHVRRGNEDAWAADPDAGVVVVADGMGGHPAGEIASRLAADEVVRRLAGQRPGRRDSQRDPSPSLPDDSSSPGEKMHASTGDGMAEAVRMANLRILEDGEDHPERRGMGTTLTALRVDRERGAFRIGHVGDSRAYVFREGALTPLTRDDSPLQEEVEAGRMTREEARVHPMSNVLSKALGTRRDVEPQVVEGSADPGDLFLLCSDGLTTVLSEERMAEILREGAGARPEEVADRLVEETLDRGAPDNVTVAVVRIRDAAGGPEGS